MTHQEFNPLPPSIETTEEFFIATYPTFVEQSYKKFDALVFQNHVLREARLLKYDFHVSRSEVENERFNFKLACNDVMFYYHLAIVTATTYSFLLDDLQ